MPIITNLDAIRDIAGNAARVDDDIAITDAALLALNSGAGDYSGVKQERGQLGLKPAVRKGGVLFDRFSDHPLGPFLFVLLGWTRRASPTAKGLFDCH